MAERRPSVLARLLGPVAAAVAVAGGLLAVLLLLSPAALPIGLGLGAGLDAGTTALGQGLGWGCALLGGLLGLAVLAFAVQAGAAVRDQARPGGLPPARRSMPRGHVIDSHAIELWEEWQ